MSDLTFQQLSDQSPANTVRVSNGSTALPAGLYIDCSALTGDTLSALSNSGVVEVVAKLLQACQLAQSAVNANRVSPNRLATFATTSGVPTADAAGTLLVTTTYTTSVRYPLDTSAPLGATN